MSDAETVDAEHKSSDVPVDESEFSDRWLVRRKPHMAPALGRTVLKIRSLRSAIAEHQQHIRVLEECIEDEALRLMDVAQAKTIGEEVDVLDALEWHGGMTFRDAEMSVEAAKRRREAPDG